MHFLQGAVHPCRGEGLKGIQGRRVGEEERRVEGMWEGKVEPVGAESKCSPVSRLVPQLPPLHLTQEEIRRRWMGKDIREKTGVLI